MKLVIAGGSSHSEDYVAKLQSHASDKIIFTGYVYDDVIRELYTNAYCYVHPSTIEGLPVTLLEALAYGNCIIASDIPANTEVVHDAGVMFESENVAGLTEALGRVIGEPALADELRAKALARGVKEYNYDRVTELTLGLYAWMLEHDPHDLGQLDVASGKSESLESDLESA